MFKLIFTMTHALIAEPQCQPGLARQQGQPELDLAFFVEAPLAVATQGNATPYCSLRINPPIGSLRLLACNHPKVGLAPATTSRLDDFSQAQCGFDGPGLDGECLKLAERLALER